jgi:hypothetical protein
MMGVEEGEIPGPDSTVHPAPVETETLTMPMNDRLRPLKVQRSRL